MGIGGRKAGSSEAEIRSGRGAKQERGAGERVKGGAHENAFRRNAGSFNKTPHQWGADSSADSEAKLAIFRKSLLCPPSVLILLSLRPDCSHLSLLF